MADTEFKVTIITPDGTVYDRDNATMIIMNTSGGQMGIMANHVPVLAALTINQLRIKHGNEDDEVVAVNGGIMQFDGKTALITADSAELPEKIDIERAEEAKKRAESEIKQAKEQNQDNDLSRAEVHLKRAINRLNVSKFNKN